MTNPTGSGQAGPLHRDRIAELNEITTLVDAEMRQVDRSFRDNLASPLQIVDEIGEFIADGGGKRLRPMLHLLCARLCAYTGPKSILLATVLEYLHCATLIHDDSSTARPRGAAAPP